MAVIRIETDIIPEQRRERYIKACDICGNDATDRTSCRICGKDLCSKHQIDVTGSIKRGDYMGTEIMENIYCKQCLLKEIEKIF